MGMDFSCTMAEFDAMSRGDPDCARQEGYERGERDAFDRSIRDRRAEEERLTEVYEARLRKVRENYDRESHLRLLEERVTELQSQVRKEFESGVLAESARHRSTVQILYDHIKKLEAQGKAHEDICPASSTVTEEICALTASVRDLLDRSPQAAEKNQSRADYVIGKIELKKMLESEYRLTEARVDLDSIVGLLKKKPKTDYCTKNDNLDRLIPVLCNFCLSPSHIEYIAKALKTRSLTDTERVVGQITDHFITVPHFLKLEATLLKAGKSRLQEMGLRDINPRQSTNLLNLLAEIYSISSPKKQDKLFRYEATENLYVSGGELYGNFFACDFKGSYYDGVLWTGRFKNTNVEFATISDCFIDIKHLTDLKGTNLTNTTTSRYFCLDALQQGAYMTISGIEKSTGVCLSEDHWRSRTYSCGRCNATHDMSDPRGMDVSKDGKFICATDSDETRQPGLFD